MSATLEMERTFAAPAQAVFDAWTSEEVMRRWWHAGHDWQTPEATVDLRVGGEVRVVMRNPHTDASYGVAASTPRSTRRAGSSSRGCGTTSRSGS